MKVAMLVQRFPCPSETFILNQITGMGSRKVDVHIYAYSGDDSPQGWQEVGRYGLKEKIFYFSQDPNMIPNNKFMRMLKAFRHFMELKAKHSRGLVRALNVRRYGMAAASLSLFYQASAFLRNGPYDIVHCHFGQTGCLAAMLKDIGVIQGRVITTFYGHDLSEYVQKNGSRVYRSLFFRGDVFIAISEIMKKRLIQLGCPSDRIVVHRLGVNLSRFDFSVRQPAREGALKLLSVGRFVEKKGLEYGIQAVARLVNEFPNLTYNIIGDGELKNKLAQLIASLNMKNNIHLLGWRSPDDVAKFMGEADMFLAPSVTSQNGDQEGTPTVIIEALARGVPVLSTFHSGIPELIQDNETGFLVPERDSDAIARKIREVCRHSEKLTEMGWAGREWVERFHDIELLNDRLVALYEHKVPNH